MQKSKRHPLEGKKNKKNIWQCWRCGACCKSFVFTGPKVSRIEQKKIVEYLENQSRFHRLLNQFFPPQNHIPIIGGKPPKVCCFLERGNICLIYPVRPKVCHDFPIMAGKGEQWSNLYISKDCPRAEKLALSIKGKCPSWVMAKTGKRKIEVVLKSFYEESMREYLGEEE